MEVKQEIGYVQALRVQNEKLKHDLDESERALYHSMQTQEAIKKDYLVICSCKSLDIYAN
jgi:hypothetical protein